VGTASERSKTLEILRTLRRRYPAPIQPRSGKITNHLGAVIVGRDSDPVSAYRACERLMAEFVDWNEIRVARCGEIERLLRPYVGERRAGEVARRLVYCLQQIFEGRGDLNLDGLAKTSPAEARKFLLALDCIDRDEANLVLLLGLGDPVMPVDGDVLRAGKRLGMISNSATKLQAQRALETTLEGEDLHACYVALREHARRVCFAESPSCRECPVARSCRYGRKAH